MRRSKKPPEKPKTPNPIDRILADALVTVVARDDKNWDFSIRFGALETVVEIVICESRQTHFGYWASHAIRTPETAAPTIATSPYNTDEAEALHWAIVTFTSEYRLAVKSGHVPQESWLVPND